MSKFVGLDLSLSSTGFSSLFDGLTSTETIKTVPKGFEDDLVRLRHISNEVMKRIPLDVDLVCVEDFYTPSNAMQIGSAIKLAMLGATVRLAMKERGVPFIIPTAGQIKKYITGKGTAQKSTIIMEVYKTYGIEAKDDNQADAFSMAHLAKTIFSLMSNEDVSELPRYQIDVAMKIYQERPRYNLDFPVGFGLNKSIEGD